MGLTKLVIRGARQHNLKNISVEIPRNTLTVITGLSGSGKSSLAFDTIYAEGQRRYVESLSAYARQFLDQMERPEVDVIEGLSPSIAIEQKTTTRSPRSTVGTITEIYDYLRVVYASVGVPHCPTCGKPITRQSSEQIVQAILQGEICKADDRIMILAPIVTLAIPLLRGSGWENRTYQTVGVSVMHFGIAVCIYNAICRSWRWLNYPIMIWIGLTSYSLDLWQQLFLDRADQVHWWTAFPQNLALAVAAAACSYYFVERPFLRLRDVRREISIPATASAVSGIAQGS